jgi:hypothetical protein
LPKAKKCNQNDYMKTVSYTLRLDEETFERVEEEEKEPGRCFSGDNYVRFTSPSAVTRYGQCDCGYLGKTGAGTGDRL